MAHITYLPFIVWGGDTPSVNTQWISARVENVLRHLKNCLHQPPDVRSKATILMGDRRLLKSPARLAKRKDPPTANQFPAGLGPVHLELPSTSTYTYPSSSSALSNFSPSPALSLLQLPFYSRAPSPNPSTPMLLSDGSLPPTPVLGDTDYDSYVRSRKRVRENQARALSRRSSLAPVISRPPWTQEDQTLLGQHLARITASCGFAYRWIENPEVLDFFSVYFPAASAITRRQLSDTLIPREAAKFLAAAKASSAGLLATMQCDGWSGINFHHFLAFMITTERREVRTFWDCTTQEYLSELKCT